MIRLLIALLPIWFVFYIGLRHINKWEFITVKRLAIVFVCGVVSLMVAIGLLVVIASLGN